MAKTIGLQITDMELMYPQKIWKSAAAMARSRGHNMILFPGRSLDYPYGYDAQNNILYNYVNSGNLDLLILLSDTIRNFTSPDKYQETISWFKEQVPLLSIGHTRRDIPSINIDNQAGIIQAVTHLSKVHGIRRIGFIRGPLENYDAQERYSAFEQGLLKNGLPLLKEMVFQGDFVKDSGKKAAEFYLAQGLDNIDAIICSNDEMLLGVYDVFHAHNVRIPDQIALVGFDDLEGCRMNPIPLASIRQPFYSLTHHAMENAFRMLEGKEIVTDIKLETEFIPRESCGCFVPKESRTLDMAIKVKKNPITDAISSILETLADELLENEIEILTHLVKKMGKILLKDNLKSKSIKKFIFLFNRLLTEFSHSERIVFIAEQVLSILYLTSEKYSPNHREFEENHLFLKTRTLIAQKTEHIQALERITNYQEVFLPSRNLITSLNSCINLKDFYKAVDLEIRNFRIKNCFITLFNKGGDTKRILTPIPATSRLKVAYINSSRLSPYLKDDIDFPSENLLPKGILNLLEPYVLTILPLFFRWEHLGNMLLSVDDLDAQLYENIRLNFSTTLKNVLMFQEKEDVENDMREILMELEQKNKTLQTQSFKDEMTSLYNRRGFYFQVQNIINNYIKKKQEVPFMLFYADMNGLKNINDAFGHSEGDQSIQAMGRILQYVFRDEDVLARFGGDEFVVFCENIPEHFQSIVDERLEKELEIYNRENIKPYNLSFCIGSVFIPYLSHYLSLDKALSEADTHLRQRKKQWKDKHL